MYLENKELLTPPVNRAAYSDRTAWMMAEFSRLAYFQFEGTIDIDGLAENLASETNVKSIQNCLKSFLKDNSTTKDEAQAKLDTFLGISHFKLISIFNTDGTQGFLASSDTLKMNVLAFRGTEKDWKDIKADLNAATIEIENHLVHSGFYHAFEAVKDNVHTALESLESQQAYPLYITGHSLGGALALIATKFLASNSIGACYTFGGPRVASSNFSDDIKTPIYRIVNAADIVPRLPPRYLPHIMIAVFEMLHIPVVSKIIVGYFKRMIGYTHHGDMRYLTATKESDYSDVKVIQNPNIIDRTIWIIQRYLSAGIKTLASDHFVMGYSKKLEAYALNRNKTRE